MGLENGALQLWGLRKSVTASGSTQIGDAITVHCSGLAYMLASLQAKLCRTLQAMPVCCLMQRLLRCCRSRAVMGGA